MHDMFEDIKGPILGAPAPFFETAKKKGRMSINTFKGSWVILFSHPDDLIPVFKTRTINYILCKRRIKAVALDHQYAPDTTSLRNFIEKYLESRSLTFLDDADEQIAMKYGLDNSGNGLPVKGVFVIDPKGYLRMKLFFPLETERNFTEILKLVDALQIADRQNKQKKQRAGLRGFKVKWSSLIILNVGKK